MDYKKVVLSACNKRNEEQLWLSATGKCDRINREEYGKKQYIQRKILFMLELNTKAGLACSRLQETILTIEDLKEQGGFTNVKNQGRTNLIFYQDSARCTET